MSPVHKPKLARVARLRPILRIVVADAKAHRRRTLVTAGLLVVAAIAPWLQTSLSLPAVVVAGAVAVAASALVIESNGPTLRVLDLNGAAHTSRAWLAAGGVLVPGTLAIVPALAGAIALAAAGSSSASMLTVGSVTVLLTVLIPWLTAVALGLVAAVDGGRTRGWVRLVRIGVVLLLVPIFPVGTAVAAGLVWVSRRRRQPTAWGLALAVVSIVVVTVLLGSQNSWTNVDILGVLLLPVLAVGVARLATGVFAGLARMTGDRRPVARLATQPLLVRRAAYAPLAATAALVLTAVTTQAVLGASLGEREARRQQQLARYDDRAGLTDQQVVAQTMLDARDQLRVVAAAERRWGPGSATVLRSAEILMHAGIGLGSDGGALAATRGVMRGPRDLVIVDPADLSALGLEAHANDLRSGRALILNPVLRSDRGVEVADPGASESAEPILIPAVRASTSRLAHDLPGVVVTSEIMAKALRGKAGTALAIDPDANRSADPVTLVVDVGHEPTPADMKVITRLATFSTPDLDGSGSMSTEEAMMLFAFGSTEPTVRAGGARVTREDGDGPLNDTAFSAARSWEASRGSLALGAAVALIILVIVAILANGLSRDDDEIIELQGGAPGTRRRLSAIQAGLMGAAASGVAALVGIGAVGVGIAIYNGSARWDALGFQDPRPLPAIPFTVPWPVLAVLVLLPAVAALVSVAVTATARRPDPRSLASRSA